MLSKVRELDFVTQNSLALEVDDVREDLDERGFAGAVGRDQGEFVPAIDAKVEVFVDDDKIILRKYSPSCIFCKGLDNIVEYNGQKICKECIEKLYDKAEKLGE